MKSSNTLVPNHVGIILDGNRRFAKRLMLKPWKGHEWGAEKVEKVLEWGNELGIHELTLYTLSLENFNRPKTEFNYLMDLFKKEFKRLSKDPKLQEKEIKINFIGRLWMLDEELQQILKGISNKTKNNSKFTVNFAIAYGGRQEVVDATIKIAEQVKSGELDISKINEETFLNNLWSSSEPDLIIRTGGETRTSNFLNFQAAYSEWIFLEKSWPEFEKEDFISAINEYDTRSIRKGI
ncbi:di-trans,poly-cis-decaprenylcistransferase [Candidatus Woesearchaeota archaeon]|jgi:tritrans,polycis-undecaprenyl-diphosphate synthase [geranylgeranyl-diphosphate specific]|nr:di-trans,poly-cis-decaprenylcistransferase [Candidatus Woesearchaeota archaeon]MBT6023215.1 di-trans,poly-cis-decaprenylcistransferase [Candidatus Woesearchaeota archaeon]